MNDIGIRSDPGEVPVLRAIRRATGMSIASAPTFLVGIDSRAVVPASTGTWVDAFFSRPSIGPSVRSMIPDLATAAEMIRAVAMITTTSLVKPEKASLACTSPVASPTSRAPSATRS